MLKTIRQSAKMILKQDYKLFMIPAALIMAMNAIVFVLVEYFGYEDTWDEFNTVVKTIFMILYFVIKFVAIPILVATIFKIFTMLRQEKKDHIGAEIKGFLTLENIWKIVLINIIPSAISFLAYSSGIGFINVFSFGFSPGLRYNGLSMILKSIALVVEYKFLMCNYYFALKQPGVKETVLFSLRIMKFRKIFRLILLSLIFLPWIVLDVVIYFVLAVCLNMGHFGYYNTALGQITISDLLYVNPLLLLNCFWFGLGFYVLPLAYIVEGLFLENLIENHQTP